MIISTKVCVDCKGDKSIDCFEKQLKNGKIYYRSRCSQCKNTYDHKTLRGDPEKWARKLARNAERRWDPNRRSMYILSDSKEYDRKHNLENNMDIEYIDSIIIKGCEYCRTSEFKVGLDRIDNSIGHIRGNIKSACTRCNFIRRDMPYDAWALLVPAIREVVEKGLFDGWTCGFNHHKRRIVMKNSNKQRGTL